MDVDTTKVSREITLSALTLHKALAQTTLVACKRLHLSEAGAMEALGANDFLQAKVSEAIAGGDGTIEVTETAAKHWRSALGLWAKLALKRDEQCQALALATNTVLQEKAAQTLLDQLQEQLGLALISVEDLVASGEPEKKLKDDAEPTEPAEETDAEFGVGTSPAPHRGPRSMQPKPTEAPKPPKTAGRATQAFTHRRGGRGK